MGGASERENRPVLRTAFSYSLLLWGSISTTTLRSTARSASILRLQLRVQLEEMLRSDLGAAPDVEHRLGAHLLDRRRPVGRLTDQLRDRRADARHVGEIDDGPDARSDPILEGLVLDFG